MRHRWHKVADHTRICEKCGYLNQHGGRAPYVKTFTRGPETTRAATPPCPGTWLADWYPLGYGPGLEADKRELFDERAAILEFDGGLERREAERQAGRLVYSPQSIKTE